MSKSIFGVEKIKMPIKFRKTGTLHEYYNPETCGPIMNSGFINWNILALNMYKELSRKKIL
jgi:putative isomerase